MTLERTAAYRRVMHALNNTGPAKLQPSERDRIRTAADTLILATTLDEARHELADIGLLAERLLTSDRWMQATLNVFVEDILACGPAKTPVKSPA